MTLSLDAAVRTLLLPVQPGIGGEYTERAEEILNGFGLAEDYSDWVNLENDTWKRTGSPSEQFREFVEKLLYIPDEQPPSFVFPKNAFHTEEEANAVLESFSTSFFELHTRLQIDEKVSHDEALTILSHSNTLFLLSAVGQMTASRIFQTLEREGIMLGKSWAAPRLILDKCGMKQGFSVEEVQELFAEDADAEAELFGDMTIEKSIEHVAGICSSFGYSGDLIGDLATLLTSDLHPPYIVMLHFQLSVLTKYHHRLTNAYEFEPRGERVLWLTGKYAEAGLPAGKSPFLNNAKSVDTLNPAWASSKKAAERHAARALVNVLSELDRLSDPSRVAAGRYLRCLFHRVLRTTLEANGPLPNGLDLFTVQDVSHICEGIAEGNTGTQGVLEQRLMDCVILFEAHPQADWKSPRGIGDSVFTTNVSRKKFGDAEVKHTAESRIVAFEAHGGRLTVKYVLDHLATLKGVLPHRQAELEDRGAITNWLIELTFLAHSFGPDLPQRAMIDGMPIEISYRDYASIVPHAEVQRFRDLMDELFRVPLNTVYVHPRIRGKVRELRL
jgi:hypothetical protein